VLESWRWFGPDDYVSLDNIVQAGARGVVTSLHHISIGEAWPLEDLQERKRLVEEKGLTWSVIESIPVHNDIKLRKGQYRKQIENYKTSIRNAAKVGVKVVCYNFMPVVDWTRTNLNFDLPNKSQALRFEMTDFAAYDVYVLERPDALLDYDQELLSKAKARLAAMSIEEVETLEKNIIAGLPGGEGSYDRDGIRAAIAEYIDIGVEGMRQNLFSFLEELIPVAEAEGVLMCIHADDPPFSLFGLPRVVSTASDVRALLNHVSSVSNGLTLCAGSFGARGDNDLVGMAQEFGPRIHFVHLRNVIREEDGSFYEAEHLGGDNDMVGLISALMDEEQRRADEGREDLRIPMRPDHGHLLGEELTAEKVNPGYSFMGRMKGLAELRGVIHALESMNHK
jgi:mannonate dehydratase